MCIIMSDINMEVIMIITKGRGKGNTIQHRDRTLQSAPSHDVTSKSLHRRICCEQIFGSKSALYRPFITVRSYRLYVIICTCTCV